MTNKVEEIKKGDQVLLEQCWEDERGYYHDEWVEVASILPDGRLKFRIGHWETRKAKEEKLQAYLNQFEWYAKDVSEIEKQTLTPRE